MHYANGKEAKVGDLVVGRAGDGRPVSGKVVAMEYNLIVTGSYGGGCETTVRHYTIPVGNCVKLEDVPS